MVNVMKWGGRAPPPSPAWANFTLVMECTPENSVLLLCVLCGPLYEFKGFGVFSMNKTEEENVHK
jgi:hypothetical protein